MMSSSFFGTFGQWKVVGHNALTTCPFHQDDQPSFSIDMKTGLWYCFGCGAHGNAEQLEKLLGFPVWDGVKQEVREVETEVLSIQPIKEYPLALDNLYLKTRGVSNEQVEKYEIRAWDDGVYFPLKTYKGQTVGFQKRRMKREGPRYVFYGRRTSSWPDEGQGAWDAYLENKTKAFMVVTEGIFGALRADAAGIMAAATFGASTAYAMWLGRQPWPYLIHAFDNDYAGWTGLMKAVDVLDVLSSHIVLRPQEVEVDQMTVDHWRKIDETEESKLNEVFFSGPIWDVQEYAADMSGDPHKAMYELIQWRKKRDRFK
jgi:DNA primase